MVNSQNPQARGTPDPEAPVPRTVKTLRALVLIEGVLVAIAAVAGIKVIHDFGPTPSFSWELAKAIVAVIGVGLALTCLGIYFALARPDRKGWWLTFLVPVLGAINLAAAVAVIPEDHVAAALVLNVLVNALLPLVVVGLLLIRAVRVYFGISRPFEQTKVA
jgi:uncharacterized membrane-anchored protein